MVYTVERFMEKNGSYLSADELKATRQYIADLKDILANGDKDAILKQIDTVNEFTRPFAERLMDQAIATAMKGKSIDDQLD
jgi:molecular chaperone HscA